MGIANFPDDNTPFSSENNIDDLIDSLEKTKINIGEFSIVNSDREKLLGVKTDNKLMFDCHVLLLLNCSLIWMCHS